MGGSCTNEWDVERSEGNVVFLVAECVVVRRCVQHGKGVWDWLVIGCGSM